MHEDGREIGRMYEGSEPSRPEIRWFWSIIVLGPARGHVKTDGRAATFAEAKAQFSKSWEAWKAKATKTDEVAS